MPPTKDATSGIYIPQSIAEWTGFIPNVAPPDAIYRAQEAAGNLADSADSFTLTASGAPNNPTYQQTLVGWASKGVGVGNAKPENFQSTSASLPDLSVNSQANSFAVLGYYYITVIPPGSPLSLLEAGNDTLNVTINSASHVTVNSGANSATGTKDAINGPLLASGVCPVLLVVNKTKGTTVCYTNEELISVSPGTLSATKQFLYGGLVVNASDYLLPYGCFWVGANAEFTDKTAHAILAGLGFQMGWSTYDMWNFQDAVVLNQGTLSYFGELIQLGTANGSHSIAFAQDPAAASAIYLAATTATGQETIWIPDANGTMGLLSAVSAGTTNFTNGQFILSNAGGVSFGMNGGTITASIINSPAISGGTQLATSGTVVFSNSNGISFGLSGSTRMTASADYVRSVSAGTTNATGNQIVFSNSNNVSFGANGATITASAASSLTNVNVSAGTTSNNLSNVVFSNSNGVTFGLSGSTITANFSLVTTANAINISAGTTSNNLTAVIFSNSNRVSFGLNGSTITAQHALNFSAGTTSQNISDQIIFSNSNAFQFGLNGSTITAQDSPISFWQSPFDLDGANGLNGTSMSFQRIDLRAPLTATRLDLLGHLTVVGSTAGSFTLSIAVYTFAGSTASSASSSSIAYTWNSGTNPAAASIYGGNSGTRWRSVPTGTWNMTPGAYLIAVNGSIAGVAGTTGSITLFGRAPVSLNADIGGGNFSAYFADAVFGSGSAAFPASPQLSDLIQTGASAQRQPFLRLVGSGP
jgi:hypothetical protein